MRSHANVLTGHSARQGSARAALEGEQIRQLSVRNQSNQPKRSRNQLSFAKSREWTSTNNDGGFCWAERIRTSDWLIQNQVSEVSV